MKPIDQTRFAIELPLTEAPGNCWAACIASILEVPLPEVPDEANFWKPGMSHRQSWRLYEPSVHRWLRERGLLLLDVRSKQVFYSGEQFDPFCIVSGPSPRNCDVNHAVVGRGMEIIHDPHPSRAGLLPPSEGREWWHEYFVAINPAQVKPLGDER